MAVKVQYEGLAAEVHADLAAARALSAVVQWLFPEYDAAEFIVGEIGHGLARELDFLVRGGGVFLVWGGFCCWWCVCGGGCVELLGVLFLLGTLF